MKKQNLLKLALVSIAMMVFTGAWAQTHDGTAIPGQANVAAYGNDGSVYMVEGTTIPLYALPDPVYHSAWDYTTATWTLTDGFIWIWSEATGTLTFSQNSAEDNYVAISSVAGDAAGSPYTVNVLERAPAAYGGCDDGVGTDITINVVTTPAITFSALDGTTPQFCEGVGLPADVIAVISGGWRNYRVAWSLEIATLAGSPLAKDFYYDDENGLNPAAGQKYAQEYTEAVPATVAAAGDYNIMTVGSFEVIDNKPTVYTYQLTSINDQALRFGNFIALAGDASVAGAFDYNAFTGATGTYTIQVNPAPTTGPIYHIPATWAN